VRAESSVVHGRRTSSLGSQDSLVLDALEGKIEGQVVMTRPSDLPNAPTAS